MTKDEALKLALEVLKRIDEVTPTAMAKLVMPEIEQALNQPEQEPVGWAEHGVINWLADKQFNHTSFLYDTPAQRTWVGLTNDELTDLFYNTNLGQMSAVGQAIELLKERNS
jgi:hypothetical protein